VLVEPERALWFHKHPPCPDEHFHPGTITVYASDGHHEYVARVYTGGSAEGKGESDDPRVPGFLEELISQ